MSLKAFHVVFITASILLALAFGVWSVRAYLAEGGWLNLVYASGSFLSGIALAVYEWVFLKKLKRVSYL